MVSQPLQTLASAPENNRILNYQIRLTDTSNVPVPNGVKNLKLTIYDADTAGTQLFSACTDDGLPDGVPEAVEATFTNGVSTILIGDSANLVCADGDAVDIPADLFTNDAMYLGVTVEADDEMEPRKRIVSAGYAMNADRLDDLETSDAGGTAAFVPVTTATGLLVLTGNPDGTDAVITANPATGDISTDDLLFNLSVNDTSVFKVDAEGDITSTGATWTIANDLAVTLSGGVNGINFDADTLSIDASSNRVGIGTASPDYTLDIEAVNPTTSIANVTVTDSSTTGQTSYAYNASYSDSGNISSGTDTIGGINIAAVRTGTSVGPATNTIGAVFLATGTDGPASDINYGIITTANGGGSGIGIVAQSQGTTGNNQGGIFTATGISPAGINQGIGTAASGNAVANRGIFIDNISGTASGQNEALRISNVTGGATNYQIYSTGTAPTYFAGSMGLGAGSITPATKLDVDSNSNTSSFRLRGAAETVELTDLYVGAGGNLIFDTTAGTGANGFIDLRGEDDVYGLVIRESDGTGTTALANLYVVDDTADYLNVRVTNTASTTAGLFVTANDSIGINDPTPDNNSYLDVTRSSTNTSADTMHNIVSDITDTGIVTTGTDTTSGMDVNVTRTGATDGTINTFGIDVDVIGDSAGTGTSSVFGGDFTVAGSGDTNYGIRVGSSGGTVNYGLYSSPGINHMGGRLGIGNLTPSAPAALLDVGVADQIQMRFNTSDTVDLGLGVSNGVSNRKMFFASEQGSFRQALGFGDAVVGTDTIFGVSSSQDGVTYNPALIVDHSGRVGIGTITQNAMLTIDPNSNSQAVQIQGLAETVELADLFVAANGSLIVSTTAGTGSAGYIEARPEDDQYGLRVAESDGTGTAVYANMYVADASDDYLNIRVTNATSSTAGVFVTASDRLGIGTSTPGTGLHLHNNVFRVTTTAADTYLMQSFTNGGANDSSIINFYAGTTASAPNMIVGYSGSSWGGGPSSQVAIMASTRNVSGTSKDIWMYANDTVPSAPQILIQANTGFVGVGTTSPDAKFDIEGAEDTERIRLTDTTNADSVGIYTGTGSPDTALSAQAGSLFLDQSGALYVNTNGTTGWANVVSGGGFANTALSNLSGVAINASLIPDSNDDTDLGSDSLRWQDIYLGPGSAHIGASATDEGVISYDTGSDIFNFGTDSTSNGDIAFFTNDLYLDKSSGFAGFGDTTPDYPVDVETTTPGTGVISVTAADASTTGQFTYGYRAVMTDSGNVSSGADVLGGMSLSVTRTGVSVGPTSDVVGINIAATGTDGAATDVTYGIISTAAGGNGNIGIVAIANSAVGNNQAGSFDSSGTTTGTNQALSVLATGSSTINRGLFISDITTTASGQNAAIVLNGVSGGATNYQIYSTGTAPTYFAGSLGLGAGSITPATKLDIDSNSNTSSLRIRGAAETVEIADLYVAGNGSLKLDLTAGTGSASFFDLLGEDDQYGVVIRESDGTGTAAFANLYVADAALDYLNIRVGNATSSSAGVFVTAADHLGVGTSTPGEKLTIAGGKIAMDNSQGLVARDTGGTYRNIFNANGDNTVSYGDGGGGWTSLRFFPGAAEAMRIASTGFVGIGSTSPDAKLDVEGAEDTERIRLTDTTNADSVGVYTGTGSPNGALSAQAGSLFLDQSGTLYINTNGTTGWSNALAAGSGDISAVGSMTSGDAFADSSADDDWLGLGSSAGKIEFDDQTIDEVNILNANVGIGDATPDAKLDVEAASAATTFALTTLTSTDAITRSGGGTHYGLLLADSFNGTHSGGLLSQYGVSSTSTYSGTASSTASLENFGGHFVSSTGSFAGTGSVKTVGVFAQASGSMGTTGTSANHYGVEIGTTTGTGDNNYGLYINTISGATTGNWQLYSAGAADSYFAGSLGLGTATPSTKLHIEGGSDTELAVAASGYIIVGATSTTNLVLDNNEIMVRNNGAVANLTLQNEGGLVGIGAIAVGTKLFIESDTVADGITINNAAADGDGFIQFQNAGTAEWTLGFDDGDSDKFKIGTTAIGTGTAFTIDSAGNVGVGDTTPDGLLDVDFTTTDTASNTTLSVTTAENSVVSSSVTDYGIHNDFDHAGAVSAGTYTLYGLRSTATQSNGTSSTAALDLYGGLISISSSSHGGSGTASVTGLRVAAAGNLGTGGGATDKRGIDVGVSGTGDINYGVYIGSVTGATTANWQLYAAGTGNSAFAGSVTIGGTTAPSEELDVDGQIQFEIATTGDTTIGVCKDSTDGTATTEFQECSSTPGDVAEWYETVGTANPGDIVAVTGSVLAYDEELYDPYTGQPTGITEHYEASILTRSAQPYAAAMLGVVSTSPLQVMGEAVKDAASQPRPIALTGRVPVRVNVENGAIVTGDPITSSSTAGAGMKATKPGMIVGTALNAWNGPGEGVIMVMMRPSYYAGGTFGTDGTLALVTDDLTTRGVDATSGTIAVDSKQFSFSGSAWDSGTSSAVTRAMTVINDVTDKDNYKLSVRNNAGAEVAYFGQTGDVAISGRLFPSDRGTMQTSRYMFYDGSVGLGGDMMRTNAAGWATGSYDFAEMFPSNDALVAGELVMVDTDNAVKMERAVKDSSHPAYLLSGIVSTRPGFLAGLNEEGSYPIALSGRVPTKVKGAVNIGDPITASDTPGVGTVATESTYIVGIALQSFDGNGVGTITVFVKPGWWNTSVAGPAAGSSTFSGPATSVLNMDGQPIIGIGALEGTDNLWSIDGEGKLTIKVIEADEVKADEFAVKADDQKSTIGESTLFQGNSEVIVANPAVKPNSRIFITFYGNTEGASWWIDSRTDGFFTLKMNAVAPTDLKFEYWVVQVDDLRTPPTPEELTPPPALDEPPAEEPPADEPEAEEPPAEEPPAEEPPAEEPPAEEPPQE